MSEDALVCEQTRARSEDALVCEQTRVRSEDALVCEQTHQNEGHSTATQLKP